VTFTVGQRVEWHYEARGGYGYCGWVPAQVVKVTAKRVTIDAELSKGGTKRVSVKPEKLRVRNPTGVPDVQTTQPDVPDI
jgi:hypothetical protein